MRNYAYFFFTLIFTFFTTVSAYAVKTDDNDNKEKTTTKVPGITDTQIFLGSILPLQGRMAEIGSKIRAGLDKSLAEQMVGDRQVHIIYANDLYEPLLTPLRVQRLLHQGIFAMIGNVGSPTAAVSLPILKQAGIPAIGFFTGSGLLRTGNGLILNYRASYTQEIVAIVDAAITAGIKPEHICAYVQNDDFGKAGIVGLQEALIKFRAPQPIIHSLTSLIIGEKQWLVEPLNNKAPINQNGPVGVYMRNQLDPMPGYKSLKNWEHHTGYNCNLIISVGTYDNLSNFVHTARSFGETWIISTISFSGADNFRHALLELEKLDPTTTQGHLHNVLTTQVTPPLDANLPIVKEANKMLGEQFDFVSLESYIIGKMMLELLRKTPNNLTPMSFSNQAKQIKLDLGGLPIDFTRNGYQGSDLVTITKLTETGYSTITAQDWSDMLNWKPEKPPAIPIAKASKPVTKTVTKPKVEKTTKPVTPTKQKHDSSEQSTDTLTTSKKLPKKRANKP